MTSLQTSSTDTHVVSDVTCMNNQIRSARILGQELVDMLQQRYFQPVDHSPRSGISNVGNTQDDALDTRDAVRAFSE